MTTVSIALATYNGGKYLDEQLQTLARQERLPDELVVTDDASTDDTVAKVVAFAAIAPFPVRLYRNLERLGYRANFMRAAALCQSEVIAFCDQDDIWEQQKLRVCLVPFDNPEVLVVYHDALAVAPDGAPLAPLEHPAPPGVVEFLQSPPMDYALGFTQLLHRSLLGPSQLWHQSLDHKQVHRRERMAHDQWFFFLGSALGSIVHIDELLVRYRQHENNTYGWRPSSRLAGVIQHLWPSLQGRAEQYAALEMGAGSRAAILGQLALILTGEWQSRTNAGAEKYRALARLYEERHRIYGSVNLRDRAAAFHKLLMNNGYRAKRDWGLGAKALLTDFCLGLPTGYRLSAAGARLTPRRSGA
jgi:glycosyltransferase involved in cell wall biosynthesis